ncbi:MAG: hypothetical protein ACXVQR_03010 [Solirubrobacteraceae bacterium]
MSSATTENDSSTTGAAYEVHVTKTEGSKVLVIEDSSFTVLSEVPRPPGSRLPGWTA